MMPAGDILQPSGSLASIPILSGEETAPAEKIDDPKMIGGFFRRGFAMSFREFF